MLLCVGGEVPAAPGTSIWHDFSVVWHFGEETGASPRLVDHSPFGVDVEASDGDAPMQVLSNLGFAAEADNEDQLLRIPAGQLLDGDTEVTRVSSVRRSKGWIEATSRGIEGTLLSYLDL